MRIFSREIAFAWILALCAGCATTGHQDAARDTHRIVIHVPTTMNVDRAFDTLSIAINNRNALAPINITIDPAQTAGVAHELYVYPVQQPRPAAPSRYGVSSGLDFNLGTTIFNSKQDGLPMVDKLYMVEMNGVAFATAATNFASVPSISKLREDDRFRILWRGHLKQTVD